MKTQLPMFECRCPKDNKKLAEISRPPISMLKLIFLCPCGEKNNCQIILAEETQQIKAVAKCTCKTQFILNLGYVLKIKCKRCNEVYSF